MMKQMTRRAGVLGLLALAVVATSGAGVAPTSQSVATGIVKAAPAGAEVQVFAFCKADGSYSFNAVGHGFSPKTSYGIYSVSTSYWTGGGKTSYTEAHGNLFSSASGYITTPTYYSQKDSNRETVSVKVVIGGVAGTDAANCD